MGEWILIAIIYTGAKNMPVTILGFSSQSSCVRFANELQAKWNHNYVCLERKP